MCLLLLLVSDVASVSDTGQTGRGRKQAGGGGWEKLLDSFSGRSLMFKLLLSEGILRNGVG